MIIQRALISFIKSNKCIFFTDPYSGMKGVSLPQCNIFFNEDDDEVVIVACYEQVRIMFFTETDEGVELKGILDSEDFYSDADAFEANRISYRRLSEIFEFDLNALTGE